jgi:hypothetical protein
VTLTYSASVVSGRIVIAIIVVLALLVAWILAVYNGLVVTR